MGKCNAIQRLDLEDLVVFVSIYIGINKEGG